VTTDRSELVESARKSIRKGSKSFAAASLLFDRTTRERVWLLYAWCRRCDDLADAQDHGGKLGEQEFAQERLVTIRTLTEQALQGKPTGDPAFDAFALVAAECGLTKKMADDVIAGFALDADGWRPRTEEDMIRYCYHVAGAVGLMMAVVMGVSPEDDETLDRACDLGLAFQLGNIARDIAEDDAAGRCYLPMEWLAEMDIPPGQHMKPPYRPQLAELARRLARLSDVHERSARFGARKLAFRQRWAVLSAAGIYGAIAREVALLGEHAWDYRVHTGSIAKLAFVARGFADALRDAPIPESQPEWRRRHLATQA
jgi:phytoene synthase